MTAIRVLLCATTAVIFFEIAHGAEIGGLLDGKSAVSTEYKARFHKIHPNGINSSEGYIAGVHNMEKDTDEESWPSFASKCAEVIKGIVAALTSAVSSEPGERTDLQLDFKNRIYHHDNRRLDGSALGLISGGEECDDDVTIPDVDVTQQQYPTQSTGMGNAADSYSPYLGGGNYAAANPGNAFGYGTQSPLASYPIGTEDGLNPELGLLTDDGSLGVTQASQDPTWNTPATKEILYRPTEQVTLVPQYQGCKPVPSKSPSAVKDLDDVTTCPPLLDFPSRYPDDQSVAGLPAETDLDDLSADMDDAYLPPYSDNLPLDNWKPVQEAQQDFLPETPTGFGDRPTSSGRLLTVAPEIYTTPSPVIGSNYPDETICGADDDPSMMLPQDVPLSPVPPKSASQISPNSSDLDLSSESDSSAYSASSEETDDDDSGEVDKCDECEKNQEPCSECEEDEAAEDQQPCSECEEDKLAESQQPCDECKKNQPAESQQPCSECEQDQAARSQQPGTIEDDFIPEEETATTYPNYLVPQATEVLPVESMPPEDGMYDSRLRPGDEIITDPGQQYDRPYNVYKLLASATEPPPNPAIYIPITNAQTESMTEGPSDLDDDCCCDEDTYDEETPTHKVICKNACRDLEQARNELKVIFDKIKKKLRCSRRLSY